MSKPRRGEGAGSSACEKYVQKLHRGGGGGVPRQSVLFFTNSNLVTLANMFRMFLVGTGNLCMYQNAYCSHKASGIERKSISFKRTHISTTLLTTFSVLFHSDSICATRRVCTNLSTYIFKLNSEPQKPNIHEHRASLGG